MSRWGLYALVPAVVFVVNLLPAFGPPTWALLVYFRLRWSLDIAVLVGMGAIAAGGGRLLLATATRALADRLPRSRRQRLETLGERARGRRSGSPVALGLFALSPIPSAQLFEAAGLLRFPLLPLTAAFFVGRVVSYSAYLWGAKATEGSHFGSLLVSSFTSPWVVGAELALVTALVWLVGGLARRRT